MDHTDALNSMYRTLDWCCLSVFAKASSCCLTAASIDPPTLLWIGDMALVEARKAFLANSRSSIRCLWCMSRFCNFLRYDRDELLFRAKVLLCMAASPWMNVHLFELTEIRKQVSINKQHTRHFTRYTKWSDMIGIHKTRRNQNLQISRVFLFWRNRYLLISLSQAFKIRIQGNKRPNERFQQISHECNAFLFIYCNIISLGWPCHNI